MDISYLDVCAHKSDRSKWGIVIATPSDYEALYHLQDRAEADGHNLDILQDDSVPTFAPNDGDMVPPQGAVILWYPPRSTYRLIAESFLDVIGRRFVGGESVGSRDRPSQAGIVLSTKSVCSLRTASIVSVRDSPQPLPCFASTADVKLKDLPAAIVEDGKVVENVDITELEDVVQMQVGSAILYKGWAGVVIDVWTEKTIRLFNNSVVVIKPETEILVAGSKEKLECYDPGLLVQLKKVDLRLGRWVYGQYAPNVDPVGVLIHVQPTLVQVDWQAHRTDQHNSPSKEEPPQVLNGEELTSPEFLIYDRGHSIELEYALDSHPEYRAVPYLRFRDIEAARQKYSSRPGADSLFRFGRGPNLGYDMNVYQRAGISSAVTVRWQDSSVSTQSSLSLYHRDMGVNDLFPGTIVSTVELKTLEENPTAGFADSPRKVGVVQSVDMVDCLARIRWFKNPQIYFEKNDYISLEPCNFGSLEDETDEVGLYDVKIPGGMDFVLNDMVRIKNPTLADITQDREWIGHITAINDNATFMIRLGAAKEPRDLQAQVDDIELVLDFEVTLDAHLGAHGHGNSDIDGDDSFMADADSYSSEEDYGKILMSGREETIDYIMENAEDANADDSDGEDGSAWSTASEGVTEREEAKTRPAQQSAFPINRDDIPAPAPYLLCEGAAPKHHRYAEESGRPSGSGLRKVMKEHTILSVEGAIPPGIYVQSWEGNCNLFRIIVLGPIDTPYARCPFIFDAILPDTYPVKPPMIFFHHWTTSTFGNHRKINPNLYEDGTVCLSLLNTWPGAETEGWMPGKSTLLQVLISIQSLILVPEPFYSEYRDFPGIVFHG